MRAAAGTLSNWPSTRSSAWLLVALSIALLSSPIACLAAANSFLLVVSGIGGEPAYSERFASWSTTLIEAAQSRMHMPRDRIVYLAENVTEGVDGRSTSEAIGDAIGRLSKQAGAGDTIFVVLIGHGTARGDRLLFNVPGPDLSAESLAALLAPHDDFRWIVVDTSPSSGPFASVLAAPNRVIVTATSDATERFHTVFAEHFVAAYAGDGADTDKDGRISALEAFEFARREVERSYTAEGRLQSEHARIVDVGNIARSSFLESDHSLYASGLPADELERLLAERDALEQRIEHLKTTKDTTGADTYDDKLEALLVEMALVHRALRAPVTKQ